MHKRTLAFSLKVLCALALVVLFAISALAQSEKILHSFTGGKDGLSPQSGLVFDSKGNLYGTTAGGGTTDLCSGCGTVFELIPGPKGAWTEQVIYSFGSSTSDGIVPYGGVVFDSKGNLYGTTSFGYGNQGTVFQLVPGPNGTWTENTLYNFSGGSDGGYPTAGVILDTAGNIYGTTDNGGAYGFGTVFELVAGRNGTWTENVLHSFTGGNDGAYPVGKHADLRRSGEHLRCDRGWAGSHDYGVVFKLTSGTWAEKILYAFTGGAAGSNPVSGLVFDAGPAIFMAYRRTGI